MPAEDGAFSGKKVYQLDDSGLKVEVKGYIAQYQWGIIKSFDTGKGLLLAFIDNSSALIFPIDQLEDSEGMAEKMKEHIA